MTACCSFSALLGRIALAMIFLLAGVTKFMEWDATVAYMASKGFTYIPFFLVAAAVVEILFSVMMIIGYKTRLSAAVLFIFLIPTTVIFHDFWHHAGVERQIEMLFFLKNVAIMGGLLYVISCGAGCFSVDHFCCPSHCDVKRDRCDVVKKDDVIVRKDDVIVKKDDVNRV